MKVRDVMFSEQFWTDWGKVPVKIQQRFNDDVERMSLTQIIPPSVQAHKIKQSDDGLWIGYVSCGKVAWRFLFKMSSSGTMIVDRILTHSAMDKILR